jgi:hypothetical protein
MGRGSLFLSAIIGIRVSASGGEENEDEIDWQ